MLAKHVDLKKRLPTEGKKTCGRRTFAKQVDLMFTVAKYGNKYIQEENICKTSGPNVHGCQIKEQRHTGAEHLQNKWT
jgi:hypothetical protein